MLFCRPLSAVTDHRRCTQLQREGGQAQISRFLSAESASTLRPTASRRDDRRASTRRSFQKACVVPTPPIAGRGECIDTSLVATAFGGSRSEDGANRRSVSQPGQASERRVAQTGSEASLFGLISPWLERESPGAPVQARRRFPLVHMAADLGEAGADPRKRLGCKFAPRWSCAEPISGLILEFLYPV